MTHARRIVSALSVLAIAVSFVVAVGRGADARHERPEITGHATISPGQTLWDVAVAHAPPGTDPRAYLQVLRDVNDLDDPVVPAWTVVLLPATSS